MTVTYLGERTIGATIPVTAQASAAVGAAASAAMAELVGKIAGYQLIVDNPSAAMPDVSAQLGVAMSGLDVALAELTATGPTGAGLAAAFSAALATLVSAQGAIDSAFPAIGLKLAAAVSAIKGLQTQIAAGVTGPNINLPTVTAELGVLNAAKAALDEQLDVAANLDELAATAGIRLYRFDGDIGLAGQELQAHLDAAGLGQDAHLVVMLPRDDAAWSGLQVAVGT